MRNQKFADNMIAQLRAEIRELKAAVRELQSAQLTTLPIYDDPAYFTSDAVEGQLVIDTTTGGDPQLQYRENGIWNVV